MSEPMTAFTRKTPLHPLAKACLAAPLLALGCGLVFSATRASDAKVAAGVIRLLLLMGGFMFAFVALLGGRGPHRERLARYGVLGLVINGVYLFITAVMFPGSLATIRTQMAHQRLDAMPVSARESAGADAAHTGILQFTNVDFSKPAEALAVVAAASRGSSGEGAAVLRAWSGVLTQLLAARLELDRSIQVLTTADVLNPATITNGSRTVVGDQFIARRLLAHHYGSALHRWEHTLASVGQRYAEELGGQRVSPERIALETQRLAGVTGSRIKPLIQLCVADQKVASHYSRAVSAMESCHPYSGLSAQENRPSLEAAVQAREFTEQLAKLENAKQLSLVLRRQMVGTRQNTAHGLTDP